MSEVVRWERPDGEHIPGVRPVDFRERDVDGELRYFFDVSSHDLRRFWGGHLLQKQSVNPSIMIQLGGWERFESIKPYLWDPRPETIADDMVSAECV